MLDPRGQRLEVRRAVDPAIVERRALHAGSALDVIEDATGEKRRVEVTERDRPCMGPRQRTKGDEIVPLDQLARAVAERPAVKRGFLRRGERDGGQALLPLPVQPNGARRTHIRIVPGRDWRGQLRVGSEALLIEARGARWRAPT